MNTVINKGSYWLEKLYHWPMRRGVVRFESKYNMKESLRRLQEKIIPGHFPLTISSVMGVPSDRLFGLASKSKITLVRSGHYFNANTKLIFKGHLTTTSDGAVCLEGMFVSSISTKFVFWVLIAMAIFVAINNVFALIIGIPILIVFKALLTVVFEKMGQGDIAWISDKITEALK